MIIWVGDRGRKASETTYRRTGATRKARGAKIVSAHSSNAPHGTYLAETDRCFPWPDMFLIRGIEFSYETVRDWEGKLTPSLIDSLRRRRKGRIGRSWYVDETYIKVQGQLGTTVIHARSGLSWAQA